MTPGGRALGRARWLVLAGTLVAASSCLASPPGGQEAGAPPGDDPSPAADVPLAGTIRQYRGDAAARILQVTVTNLGPEPIRVTSARLDSPGFDPLPATPKSSRIPAGDRVDLRVPYGDARCGDLPTPLTATTAQLQVQRGDEAAREVRLAVADGAEALERIRDRDCDQRALDAAVTLTLGPPWQALDGDPGDGADDVVRGVLRARRGEGDSAVTVTDVANSVIFAIRTTDASGPAWLTLPAGETEAAVQVELSAARCDQHALTESKFSYTFPIRVAVGDGEPVATTVRADEEGRTLLDRLIRTTCLPGL